MKAKRPMSKALRSFLKSCAITALLIAPVILAACSGTDAQVNLRKSVYAIQSAYQTLAAPMPDIIAGKNPLVKISDEQAAIAAKASQSMVNQIQSMVSATQNGSTVTSTAVSSLTAAWTSFQSCWAGIKLNTIPTDCAVFTAIPAPSSSVDLSALPFK